MTFCRVLLAALLLAVTAPIAPAQSPPPAAGVTFNTGTTLVLVPALVRTKSGQLVYTLKASDFSLTDNGVPQKLSLEQDTDSQPLALVIIVENGGYGAQQLDKLSDIGLFLEALVGNVHRRVAIISFDSTPHIEQPFTTNMNTIAAAMKNITPGNNGAAILDSIGFAVEMLRKQPDSYRRAILLFSETIDRGSTIDLSQTLRAITDTNTTIYSLGFSTPRHEFSGDSRKAVKDPTPGPPGGCMAKDPNATDSANANTALRAWNCLGLLVPPIRLAQVAAIAAIDSMRRNTPETVARLTGGEYYKVESLKSVTRDLMTISNHVPNRYVLSFSPQSPAPGPHVLELRLNNYPDLRVSARSTYWADVPQPAQ